MASSWDSVTLRPFQLSRSSVEKAFEGSTKILTCQSFVPKTKAWVCFRFGRRTSRTGRRCTSSSTGRSCAAPRASSCSGRPSAGATGQNRCSFTPLRACSIFPAANPEFAPNRTGFVQFWSFWIHLGHSTPGQKGHSGIVTEGRNGKSNPTFVIPGHARGVVHFCRPKRVRDIIDVLVGVRSRHPRSFPHKPLHWNAPSPERFW